MGKQAIPLEVLDQQEREIDAEIARLTMRRDMLRGLRALAVDFPSNGHTPQPQPTLTNFVVDFVRDHPGLTSTEIAEMVIDAHAKLQRTIGGSDPRKSVLTTVGAVAQKGRIRKDADGRYYPGLAP